MLLKACDLGTVRRVRKYTFTTARARYREILELRTLRTVCVGPATTEATP